MSGVGVAQTYAVIAFGFVIFVLACWVLVTFAGRRDEITGAPVGVALTAFGLVFAFGNLRARLQWTCQPDLLPLHDLCPPHTGRLRSDASERLDHATHQKDSATVPTCSRASPATRWASLGGAKESAFRWPIPEGLRVLRVDSSHDCLPFLRHARPWRGNGHR